MDMRHRTAWIAMQSDGNLVTLFGPETSLEAATAERDEAAKDECVVMSWVQVAAWSNVDGSGAVGPAAERLKVGR